MPGSTFELVSKEQTSRFGSQHINQIVAAMAVSFGPFAVGMGKGYTSPALASLQGLEMGASRSPDLIISDQEGSWVASLSLLGALLGGLFSSLILKHGRRKAILVVALPFSLSWWLTIFANSVEMIYITAFLVGFFSAIVQLATQVYISEIAHPSIRASLCSTSKVSSQVGLLASFAMGAWLNWRQLAIMCAIGPIMALITTCFVPETPSYLLYTNQEDEAAKSLQWLRGGVNEDDMSTELATIYANIRRKREQGSDCKNVIAPQLLKPLFITCSLMFFHRFSGVAAFNFYAIPIFRESFESFNPHLAAVLSGSVQLLASAVSGILCDLIGRLPLLIISSISMSAALAGFGTFSYYQSLNSSYQHLDWIPLACVVTFVTAFSLGLNPISWLLIGEIFPLEYRSIGPSIATAFNYVCAFVGVKTFVDLRSALGLFGTFWTYSAITALGFVFTVLLVPETKGRILDEMEPKISILKRTSISEDPSKV